MKTFSILLLTTSFAFAQPIITQKNNELNDLDKAMNICEGHLSRSLGAIKYSEGWEACYKIREKWNSSATAIQQAKDKEKEVNDKSFIDKLSK